MFRRRTSSRRTKKRLPLTSLLAFFVLAERSFGDDSDFVPFSSLASSSSSRAAILPPTQTSSSSTEADDDRSARKQQDQQRPFLKEPYSKDPLFLREKEPSPLLQCSVAPAFRNRSRYELEWLQVAEHTPILVSRNNRLYKMDAYELSDTVTTDGGYNLKLKSVNLARDNGRFFCSVNDLETGHQMVSQPVSVVVLVSPQAPRITVQPSEPVREGDFVTFRCDTTKGNPPPRFNWAFENRTKVPSQWHHEIQDPVQRRTTSTLQWHIKARDNRATLLCQVWNQALGSEEFLAVQTTRLNVLYAPRVKLTPSTTQNGGQINVEEGKTVELGCSADANPAATQFQWVHVGTGEQFQSAKWPLLVRRSHTGDFYCSATNSLGTASEKLRLQVQYGPVVRIVEGGAGSAGLAAATRSVISPIEGGKLKLECEVDANPGITAVAWSGPNGFSRNGTQLVIEHISRSYSGTFTCTCWNTLELSLPSSASERERVMHVGHATIAVDVRHRPGPAVIVTERTQVLKGEPLQIQCRTDQDPGSPKAQFRWFFPTAGSGGGLNVSSPLLRIGAAEIRHSGVYRCTPYNEIGEGESVAIDIQVIEPARINKGLDPLKLVSGDQDKQLVCEAVGYPEPRLHWFRDSVPLTSSEAHQPWVIQQRLPHVDPGCRGEGVACPIKAQSVLHFPGPIDWRAKGNYSCQAENSVLVGPHTTYTIVNVVHNPVVLNPRFGDKLIGLAAAELGATARIGCIVSARPEPHVSWYREGEEIGRNSPSSGGRFVSRTTRLHNRVDEYQFVLEVHDVTESDFGAYICKAKGHSNLNDSPELSEIAIHLQPKSSPQAPSSVRMLASGTTWVLVGWRPGFDGGDRQFFQVNHRGPVNPHDEEADADQEWTSLLLNSVDSPTMLVYDRSLEGGLLPETYFVQNFTGLRVLSTYKYQIQARNSLGHSESAVGSFSTQDVSESTEIPKPESIIYIAGEKKLNIVLPRNQLALAEHCLFVSVTNGGNSDWHALNCFPINESGAPTTIDEVWWSKGYKAKICTKNLSSCSISVRILMESGSVLHQAVLALVVLLPVFCVLILALVLAMVFRRRRNGFHKEGVNHASTAGFRLKKNVKISKMSKKKHVDLRAAGVTIDRIDAPLGHSNVAANTAAGSQADSGVFTLNGSASAMTAAALSIGAAANGHHPAYRRSVYTESGFNDHGCGSVSDEIQANFPPNGIEPYDFSNDPYLADFVAQNEHRGIVVVENGLHSHSSPSDSPNCASGENRYARFFESLSALIGPRQNGLNAPYPQNGAKVGSGDPLVTLDSDSAGSYSGTSSGPRVMREVIV